MIVLDVKANVSCLLIHVCLVNKKNVCQSGRGFLERMQRVCTLEKRGSELWRGTRK